MKIGLGSHLGSDAEIGFQKFGDLKVDIIITLILLAVMLLIFVVMGLRCIYQ